MAYGCLVRSELDPIQMLQSFSYANEGYQVNYMQVLQTRRGDTFWLSMLLLGAGEREDEYLFNNYVEFILKRVIAQGGDAKEYMIPLYVAELIFTQVFKKDKADFEITIIKNIPNLGLVLSILLANQGDLTQPVKSELLERISEEWNVEESLMKQKRDSNLKVLNDYIQKIDVH